MTLRQVQVMREGRRRDAAAHTDTPGAAVTVARKTRAIADLARSSRIPARCVLPGAHQRCTPKMSDRMEQSVHAAAEPTDARRRRQQMMAQPRVTNA